MNIDRQFLKELADSLSRPNKKKEEVYVFQEKTDEYLWSLVPKMKELVPSPKSKDKVVNEKYSDQEIFDQLRVYFDTKVLDEVALQDQVEAFKYTLPIDISVEEGKKLIQDKFNQLVGWTDTKCMDIHFWSKFGGCQYTQIPYLVENNTDVFSKKLSLSGFIYGQLYNFDKWYQDYCNRVTMRRTIFTSPYNSMEKMEEELSVKKIKAACKNFYLDKTKDLNERIKVFSKYGDDYGCIWYPYDKDMNKIFQTYVEKNVERHEIVTSVDVIKWWIDLLSEKNTKISFKENKYHPNIISKYRNYVPTEESINRLRKYYLEKLFIEGVGSFEVDW
jgi:hypothetical protein